MMHFLSFLAALVSACLIHEYGHLTAALLQSVPVKQLGWKSYHGAFLRREKALDIRGELLICAAGPVANLLAAWFLYPMAWFWSFNLVLGLTNLLPLFTGSDGDRILRYWLKESA